MPRRIRIYETIERSCIVCEKAFQARLVEIKRGRGICCSRSCAMKLAGIIRNPDAKILNVTCAYCGIAFHKSVSKMKTSKSGLYFCNMDHKSKAQRIGGIKEVIPSHYGETFTAYRKLAKKSFTQICNRCGYGKHPEILEVHHKDTDHFNNDITNLEMLCPTCHDEHHFLTNTGKYGPKCRSGGS